MIYLNNICSLTDFQRNAREHIERLKKTGRPQVLTVNGKAQLVVQDAESYQKLLELADRAEAIEGIRRGLESMERGEGRPADEVFEEIRKKQCARQCAREMGVGPPQSVYGSRLQTTLERRRSRAVRRERRRKRRGETASGVNRKDERK